MISPAGTLARLDDTFFCQKLGQEGYFEAWEWYFCGEDYGHI
jgi:hypothetical protein